MIWWYCAWFTLYRSFNKLQFYIIECHNRSKNTRICIEVYGVAHCSCTIGYQITILEFLCIPGSNMRVWALITFVLMEVFLDTNKWEVSKWNYGLTPALEWTHAWLFHCCTLFLCKRYTYMALAVDQVQAPSTLLYMHIQAYILIGYSSVILT